MNSIQALWPDATVDDVIDIMHMKVCPVGALVNVGVRLLMQSFPCSACGCVQGLKSREQTDLLSTLGMSASDAKRSHSAGGRNLGAVTSNMMSSMTKGFEALRK